MNLIQSTFQQKDKNYQIRMSNKKINARVQKWRTMLTEGLFKNPDTLRSRVRKGIPPSIRMVAWPEITKLKRHIEQRSVQISYEKLVNSLSKNVYEISLDIPRTFPEEEDSKVLRKSMNNVLKSIAIIHPKVGYCQGMNFLALRIIETLDDQTAFWLLDYIFQNDAHVKNNFIDPKHIELNNYIFQKILTKQVPKILKILQQKGIFLQAYTIKCFMTLYSGVFKQEVFYRIFEIYLLEGWGIIYGVGVALFKKYEKEISSLSMEQIHVLLGKKIFEVNDIDELLKEAFQLNISQAQLKQLEKQYLNSLRESTKLKDSSVKREIQKRELENKSANVLIPQNENIGMLMFQNKAEQVNFDSLYILKNRRSETN